MYVILCIKKITILRSDSENSPHCQRQENKWFLVAKPKLGAQLIARTSVESLTCYHIWKCHTSVSYFLGLHYNYDNGNTDSLDHTSR